MQRPSRLVTSRRLSGIARITTRHSVARAIIASGLLALVGIVVLGTLPAPSAIAATGINKQINFQGKVVNTNGTNVANGSYSFVFSIYTVSSGGSNIWTETKSLTVTDGVFQTNLGSVTSLPGSIDFNTDNIYLGINFNSDGEMTPRIQFTAAAYAFNAENANKLGGIAASGFVQLSPGSAQTGNISVSGTINGATISGGTLSGSTLSASSLTFSAASGASIQAAANQNLTLSTVTSGTLALASAGAVNITGAANSTFDVGSGNTLSLQTTNNGPITTGTGLLTAGGNLTFGGTAARTITGPGAGGLTITDAGGNLTLSTTTSGNISANSAGTIALTGTNFSLTSAGVLTLAGNQTADITTTATGAATPITIQPGSSSNNSGTGANLVLKAGNESGSSSTGGSITIDAGTGTTNGNVNIGTTNAATTTVGRSGGTTTINGNASSTIVATNGANSTTLSFVTPTGTNSLLFPDAGGTLCTTTTCATGGTGSYIQNGTTQQASANFNISGTGVAAASLQAPILSSVDTSTASTNSGNVVFRSGNATGTTSNSGNVTVDAGSATGTAGTVSVGTTNSTGTTIGRTGAVLTLQGNQSTTLSATNGANSTTLAFANPTSGGATTITLPFGVGGTVCTTTASTCNTVYQPYAAGGYLAKGANDSSTATYVGNLYNFTNQSTGASGVLALTGYGTNSPLSVATSGAVTLTAGQAVILANAATGLSGNLIDLQVNAASKFKVNQAGDVTSASAIYNGQTISSAASFTGTVTAATGLTVTSGGLTVTAGGATITAGGLNVNATGITNAGAVGGATSLTFTGATADISAARNIALTGTISGGTTYTASTSLQAPLVDAASAVTLGLGTGTASSVTLGRNTSTNAVNIQGSSSSNWVVTGAAGTTTLQFTAPTTSNVISFPDAGGTVCTTVAATCNTTYQAYSATGYLAKNATDTSSAAAGAGFLYGFTNSSSALAGGVLSLTNGTNTGNSLYVTTAGNPGSGSAVIFGSNTNASPSGNLIDLQSGSSPTSKFSVTSAGAVSTASTINLQTISSAANFTGTVGVASTLTVGVSAGNGGIINNGSTIQTVYNMGNLATGGWDAGGAAATVDKYTYIRSFQTTASQTLTIPTPTANTTFGRVLYLSNGGTTSFTLLGTTIGAGSTATLIWTDVNGTGTWTFAGADGSGILNQNSADQTANFRISGTGRANTSFTAPLFDVSAAGTLSVGTGTATGITIGGASTTGTIAIGNSAANTINIGSSANAHTISIGTDATTVQAVSIGSSSGASATTLYGGSGNINLNAGKIVSNQASVDLLNTVTTAVNAFGASTAVAIGANNTVVTFGNSGAATLRSVTGALTITSAAAATWSATGNLTVDSSATLNLGTGNATGVSIGKTTTTTNNLGTLQVGNAAGVGGLVNNGSTIQTVYNMGNLATGGWDAGGAAATVDKYTYIRSFQTTASQTLTIPTPTANTTFGRVLYLSNGGTTSFTLLGTTIGAGSTATLIWTDVNGTGTWTFAGADGSGILNQNSADQTANFRISGTGRANTSFTAPLFDTASASLLSIGTGTANAISIGATGVTTTAYGTLRVGATTGTGAFLNNGSTVNTAYTMNNLATGGWDAGGAAATVDIYTYIRANQTTGGQTLTVPAPTANTTYGRMLYLSNGGTASFTLLGTTIGAGSTATLIWTNVNGVGTWTFAGADGSGILNQNSADQTANFRISGTGRANTSFTAPLFDTNAAGTLSVGTATATTIQLGSNGATNPIINIDSGTSGINIGTGAQARTIAIGTGGAVQGITIGSTTAGSTALIQGPSVSVGTAGASIFRNLGATYNATCDYTGVTGATTLNTAAKTPDVCTVFRITTTGAATVTVPAPAAGAGSVVYVSNMAASSNAITLLSASLAVGSTATLVYNGTAWTYAGADSSGLQTSYNNSAGAAPSIAMNTTNRAVTLQSSATTGIAAGNELFGVRAAAANDTTLGNSILTVSTYGLGINIGTAVQNPVTNAAYDLQFGGTANRTIAVIDQATAATVGRDLTVKAAAGNTSGAGGNLVLVAGAGGNAAGGGNASLTGGAAGGGNTNGGSANIQGGLASGNGTGGAVNITGGSGSTTTASTGGTVTIQGGAAGAVAGGAVGGVSILGGVASTTGTGGAGGNITLTASNAGGSGNNAGGNIRLTAGTATGAGVPGVVSIDQAVFTNQSTTFTQTANNQSFPGVGVPTAGTFQTYIDGYSTITINMAGAFTGATVNIPAPTNTAAIGRLMYVAAANGSVSFTLSSTGMKSIFMSANSTAMLVWNGTYWSGSAAATSLQDVYNNTSSSPAGIITTSATKNILFQAGTGFDNANVFQIGNSSGATIFTVDTTNTATGQNISVNGAAESTFGSEWSAHGASTVTRDVTTGEFATGVAGVKVATTGASQGVRNNLGAALAVSTKYLVSFSVKSSDNWGNTDIAVEYYRNNTPTLDATCSSYSGTYVPTINSSTWVKYSCFFTTSATAGAATDFLAIRQTAAATRSIFIDNLSIVAQNATGTQDVGALRVGGALSQGLNLLTLDSYAAAPFSGVNPTLLGSMYYDTSQGRIQCYEQDGWGPCGSAPNNSFIMVPEYGSAVLGVGTGGDTHIGTMTANMCSGSSRFSIQPTEGTVCASTEEYNYYRWTSGQTTAQTYSIFAKYQLPPTFNNFLDDNTIKAVGRVSNTTDASVSFGVYGSTGTQCGSTTSIASAGANTWYTTNLGGSGETTCGFAAGDIVTFKIDMSSKNNAYAYMSNILFTMTGK